MRKRKLLILGDANSPHIRRLLSPLLTYFNEILLFSLRAPQEAVVYPSLHLETPNLKTSRGNLFVKLLYLKALPHLKRVIRRFQPDILYAHYVTSYGFLGVLSGFRPLALHIWGSDILIFPEKSFLHRSLIRYILSKADLLIASSRHLRDRAQRYIRRSVEVVPLGVDLDVFKPFEVRKPWDSALIIGSTKNLYEIYGLDRLILAFKRVRERVRDRDLRLLLVGSGSQERYLRNLVGELGLRDHVVFAGRKPYNEMPTYVNVMDILVFPSLSEGLGVSAIEASACEKPVIASDLGGFREVVIDGETGFLVPLGEPEEMAEEIAQKLVLLINDDKLRLGMGKRGREHVMRNFSLRESVKKLLKFFEKLFKKG